jgi:hypothetical protein
MYFLPAWALPCFLYVSVGSSFQIDWFSRNSVQIFCHPLSWFSVSYHQYNKHDEHKNMFGLSNVRGTHVLTPLFSAVVTWTHAGGCRPWKGLLPTNCWCGLEASPLRGGHAGWSLVFLADVLCADLRHNWWCRFEAPVAWRARLMVIGSQCSGRMRCWYFPSGAVYRRSVHLLRV